MAQAPKLTPEEWDDARQVWEQDEREGFTWLVNELALPVSAPGVRKRAVKDGWVKQGAAPAASAKPSKPSRKRGVEIVEAPQAKGSSGKGSKAQPARETAEKPETIEKPRRETVEEPEWEPCDDAADEGFGRDEQNQGGVTKAYTSRARVWGEEVEIRGKYISTYPGMARSMAKAGFTDEQMAEAFGVSRTTLLDWRSRHPVFAEEWRKGKLYADALVAESTFIGATGFEHPEEVIRVLADGTIVRVPTVKYYPPNPVLNMFWLKNRQPELWKERVELKEQPTIALVDKQAMDDIYRNALEHAAKVRDAMTSRADRLGLTIDHALDDGE